ncbi:MAG: AMP-binding protein [Coprococcus sp.]|nr:AMP-binding protein [Coprococcus sp.]
MKNIIQKLQEHCLENENGIAFSQIVDIKVEENNISNDLINLSYKELLYKVECTAYLLSKQYKKGDRVMLVFPSGIDFVVAILACFYAGIIAVPCHKPNPNRTGDKVDAIIGNCHPVAILTSESYYKVLSKRTVDMTIPLCIVTDEMLKEVKDEELALFECVEIKDSDIALLQYTSGSTSDPKGVIVTHKNIASMCEYIDYYEQAKENDKSMTWLPNYHDMGLIEGLFTHLYVGTQCFIISTRDIFIKPHLWLYFLSKYKINISGAPNFLFDKCIEDNVPLDNIELSHVSVLYNGAEPIRAKTMLKFYQKFSQVGLKAETLYAVYGLAEGTLLVTSKKKESISEVVVLDDSLVGNKLIPFNQVEEGNYKNLVFGCGEVCEEYCDVAIVGENGERLGENQIGDIYICGDGITAGYWNNPAETSNAYNHYLDGKGPYLKTGDLGFIKGNKLFLTGRSKDLLIINGKNIYPQDLEFAISEVSTNIENNSIAIFSTGNTDHAIVAVVEVNRHAMHSDLDKLADDIHERIVAEFLINLSNIVLVKAYSLPKTSSGKIQRSRCKSIYLDNGLKVLLSKEYDNELAGNMLNNIDTILDQFMDDSEQISYIPDMDKSFLELGVDSIQLIQLAHKISFKYQIKYSLEDLLDNVSVIDLGKDIKKKLAEKELGQQKQLKIQEAHDGHFPATIGQKSLFLIQNSMPEEGLLNIGKIVKVGERIEKDTVLSILNKMVEGFQLLASKMQYEQENLIFSYDRNFVDDVIVEENPVGTDVIEQKLEEAFYRPFEMIGHHLFRINMMYDSMGNTFLSFSFHHIIADFWSLVLFMDSFFHMLGECEYTLKSVEHSNYSNFAYEVNALLQQDYYKNKVEEFKKLLNDKWELADVHAIYKRNYIESTYNGTSQRIELSAELSEKVEAICQENSTTKYIFLFAVFELLIYTYIKQNEIILGTTFSGRDNPEYSNTFGFFTSVFPVLSENFEQELTVKDLIQRVKKRIRNHLKYADLPLHELSRNLNITEKANNRSLFNLVFSFQNTIRLNEDNYASLALEKTGKRSIHNMDLEFVDLKKKYSLYDIDFQMTYDEGIIQGDVVYNSDLFDKETIQDMINAYVCLVENVVDNFDNRLSQIELISPVEKEKIFNEIDESYKSNYDISDGFLSKFNYFVENDPDLIAVIDGDNHISYAALNVMSNRLARKIHTDSNAIGLFIGRNVYFSLTLLAALKIGKQIVPIDVTFPSERILHIMKECNIDQLIIEEEYIPLADNIVKAFEKEQVVSYVVSSTILDNLNTEQDNQIIPTSTIDNFMYTIFTSGSTGKPKGVSIREKNIIPLFEWKKQNHKMSKDIRMIQCLSLGFDFGLSEIFATLFYGCRLYFTERYVALNPEEFILNNDKFYINTFYMTPSMVNNIVKYKKRLNHARRILLGGERLSIELTKELRALIHEDCKITNGYGPTEASINCLMYDVTKDTDLDSLRGNSVPIGFSTGQAKLIVLDENHHLVPQGGDGVLYICGVCVSDGYINNPELTSQKFLYLNDVFHTDRFGDKRIYMTGDKVREIEPYNFEFLGRVDSQIKVRGYRIELNEIVQCLKDYDGVRDVAIYVTGNDLKQAIVAYIVTDVGKIELSEKLKSYLDKRLPYYMIPNELYVVESIPLNRNGKLDFKALEAMNKEKITYVQKIVEESDEYFETKSIIIDIWKKVLKTDQFTHDDNFFECGGHSLQIVDVHHQLEEKFNIKIPFSKLFELSTINEITEYISSSLPKENKSKIIQDYHADVQSRRQLREEMRNRRGGIK